mgnify:FL=1
MKMFCKECNKKYYTTATSWVGYPQGSGHWDRETSRYISQSVPAGAKVFHSRFCWESWTAKNIDAYTLWLHSMGNNDTNNETIEERNNYG